VRKKKKKKKDTDVQLDRQTNEGKKEKKRKEREECSPLTFLLFRLIGDGLVLLKGGGATLVKDLAPGEMLRVASGSIIAFERNVHYDVQMVKGAKNILFVSERGEREEISLLLFFFFTVLLSDFSSFFFLRPSLFLFVYLSSSVLRAVRVSSLLSSLVPAVSGFRVSRLTRWSVRLRPMWDRELELALCWAAWELEEEEVRQTDRQREKRTEETKQEKGR
jgi:hypothetical protein